MIKSSPLLRRNPSKKKVFLPTRFELRMLTEKPGVKPTPEADEAEDEEVEAAAAAVAAAVEEAEGGVVPVEAVGNMDDEVPPATLREVTVGEEIVDTRAPVAAATFEPPAPAREATAGEDTATAADGETPFDRVEDTEGIESFELDDDNCGAEGTCFSCSL